MTENIINASSTQFDEKLSFPVKSSIVLHSDKYGEPLLRVSTDGFYVRGKKVPQDDNEAQVVYEAFKTLIGL